MIITSRPAIGIALADGRNSWKEGAEHIKTQSDARLDISGREVLLLAYIHYLTSVTVTGSTSASNNRALNIDLEPAIRRPFLITSGPTVVATIPAAILSPTAALPRIVIVVLLVVIRIRSIPLRWWRPAPIARS